MATVYDFTNDYLAHTRGVRGEVRSEASAIEARARSALAGHRETGSASIEVEHGITDSLVSLVDEHGAASAIEYGGVRRTGRDEPQVIQGLYILHRAANL